MSGMKLEALRAKREEAVGAEAPVLEAGDEVFTFPASVNGLPFDAIMAFQRGAPEDGLIGLFGAEQWERFRSTAEPTVGDINDIAEWLMGEYGLGESSASSTS